MPNEKGSPFNRPNKSSSVSGSNQSPKRPINDNVTNKSNQNSNTPNPVPNNPKGDGHDTSQNGLNNVKDKMNDAVNNVPTSGVGALGDAKDRFKQHLDDNRVKSSDELGGNQGNQPKSDAKDQIESNKLGKGKGDKKSGETPQSKGTDGKKGEDDNEGKKGKDSKDDKGKPSVADKAKDGAKDKAKEMAKSKAKDGVKNMAGKSAQKAGAGVGAKVGAGGGAGGLAGAGVGLVALKLWGMLYKGGMAMLGSIPMVMLKQTMGFVAKAVSAVTGAVNGAINSVLGFFGSSVAVAGSAPAVATVTAVSATTSTVVMSSTDRLSSEEELACVGGTQTEVLAKAGLSEDSGMSGSDGDWKKEGTEAYKVAKEVFDYWVGKGLGGATASGIVGNVYQESKFEPTRKQTPYGTYTDDPKTVTGAIGTNGYGLYQISPGAKYGNWSGFTKSTALNQSDYVWEAYNGARTSNGLKNNKKGLEVMINAKTPEEGAWHFYDQVENGGQKQSDYDRKSIREGIAREAYELFGGANHKADKSLLNSSGTGDANDSASDLANSINNSSGGVNCTDLEDGSGGNIGAADGTGSIPDDYVGQLYLWEDLPAELRKFAYDPRDMGLTYNEGGKGWWKPSGQCVGLSSSYFSEIWEGATKTARGNGNVIAFKYAETMKGEMSKLPKKGDINSIQPTNGGATTVKLENGRTVYLTGSQYGHTQVVQHVFANGDFLVVEQNYPRYSGDSAKKPYTWHFRVMPKEAYETGKMDFFHPDEKKYKLRFKK